MAYRSLAQGANDAARTLLAPLVGVDLYGLAVPGSAPEDVTRNRERLVVRGRGVGEFPASGSWPSGDRAQHEVTLRLFVDDVDFLRALFRSTASQRRRVQDATGLWAPVMFISHAHSASLADFRDVTDALEILQERTRALLYCHESSVSPPSRVVEEFINQFWATVAVCEAVRTRFGDAAELPSDSLTGRRRGADAP